MRVLVLGIDCATLDAKIGVAVGSVSRNGLTVQEAFACTKEDGAVGWITKRLKAARCPALIAIDAPLGWPQTLAQVLSNHQAGRPLQAEAHDMFRRETDRFIRRKTGKTPLEVGADRIARTAHAALRLLRDIKSELRLPDLPLAWEPPPSSRLSTIEVYPAATLIAHGFASGKYKKPEQSNMRKQIIKSLDSVAKFKEDVAVAMLANADVLDAVVCLVAAHDFLHGDAMKPENRRLAELEGWIWTRKLTR